MPFELTPYEPTPDLDTMSTDDLCAYVVGVCEAGDHAVDALLVDLHMFTAETNAGVLGAATGWAASQLTEGDLR